MRELRVPVEEGVSLHALRWDGAGRAPFLLVHGLASNLGLWAAAGERLAALGHDVVAVDQRGHGRSDKPDHGYDLDTACADLLAVIEATGLDRPVLAGQSWGGNVVLELGARRPERLRGVVCVDGGWIEPTRRFPDWESCRDALRPPPLEGRPAAEIEAHVRSQHPDWPEQSVRGALANFEVRGDGTVAPWLTLDRHLSLLRALWDHRPSQRYADVSVPVLLVPALGRSVTSEEAVAHAEQALPRARTHGMRGDHDIHAQRPDEIAALLHGAVEDGFFA